MSDDESLEELAPDLTHLVTGSAKWIFVGGKGGVGKTTTSCALSLQLARHRAAQGKQVLLISTDPAHNLSDAFQQKFGDQPQPVNGIPNLFAMETDPQAVMEKQTREMEAAAAAGGGGPNGGAASPFGGLAGLQELASSMPGIDEAISFAELMKQVRTMQFDAVVFDTAPTGHTLRLLALPDTIEKGINTMMNSGLSSAFKTMQQMMMPGAGDPMAKMGEMKQAVEEIRAIFQNPDLTTFVCVCIPEFLSVFETERLIQELAKFDIDCQNVVVNQVLFPEPGSNCSLCKARANMQGKYLAQIDELYEDFHVVKMPLLHNEVRGVDDIEKFSQNLLKPFKN